MKSKISLVFLLFGISATFLVAQEKPSKDKLVPLGEQELRIDNGAMSEIVPTTGEMIVCDFPGGTLEELCAYLEKIGGERPNLIIPSELKGEVKIPDFKIQIRRGYFSNLFATLANLDLKVKWIKGSDGPAGTVWTLRKINQEVTDERGVFSFSLERPLQIYSLEDIITAIKTALDLAANKAVEAELKVHKETKLLIFKGNHGQASIVEKILNNLSPLSGEMTSKKEITNRQDKKESPK